MGIRNPKVEKKSPVSAQEDPEISGEDRHVIDRAWGYGTTMEGTVLAWGQVPTSALILKYGLSLSNLDILE